MTPERRSDCDKLSAMRTEDTTLGLCHPCYHRKRYVEKHEVKRFQRQIDSELRGELKAGYGGKCSWCGRLG